MFKHWNGKLSLFVEKILSQAFSSDAPYQVFMEIEEQLALELIPTVRKIRSLNRRQILYVMAELERSMSRADDEVFKGMLWVLLEVCRKELRKRRPRLSQFAN